MGNVDVTLILQKPKVCMHVLICMHPCGNVCVCATYILLLWRQLSYNVLLLIYKLPPFSELVFFFLAVVG